MPNRHGPSRGQNQTKKSAGSSLPCIDVDQIKSLTTISCKLHEGIAEAWAAPLPLLGRALGTGVPGTAPAFRHVLLLDYLFKNKGVTPDLHWISIYDEDAVSYRVTLYDNIAPGNEFDGSRVTVETLWSEYPDDIEEISERVRGELGELTLVDDARSGEFIGHE